MSNSFQVPGEYDDESRGSDEEDDSDEGRDLNSDSDSESDLRTPSDSDGRSDDFSVEESDGYGNGKADQDEQEEDG